MAEPSGSVERRAARQRFERAARTYAGAAGLEAEIGARMLERLQYVRLEPQRILDAGAGAARDAAALAKRYPNALVIALDFSLAMLRAGGTRRPGIAAWFGARRRTTALCADLTCLPIASGSVALLWSNLALPWVAEPLEALREFHRVLAPEGLLMLSSLGPDTLKELRSAAGEPRMHRFLDMHDLGDRIVACGFGAPVIDMEQLTLTYASPQAFLDEQRRAGRTGARADRPRGLAGRRFRAALLEALAAQARDARLGATYEVVYGHAWKGSARGAGDGRAVVRIERARRGTR